MRQLLALGVNESQECGETEESVLGTCLLAYESWYLEGGGQFSAVSPEA